jgi:excisionase family DNA binding protein
MNDHPDLLTASELAVRLKVTPETVRGWTRRGVIPAVRISRKVIRYNEQAVLASLAARDGKGAAHGA